MADEHGLAGGLRVCPACGISFDHDVSECPDCGRPVAVKGRRALVVVIVAVVVLVVLAALWAANITPISTDFGF